MVLNNTKRFYTGCFAIVLLLINSASFTYGCFIECDISGDSCDGDVAIFRNNDFTCLDGIVTINGTLTVQLVNASSLPVLSLRTILGSFILETNNYINLDGLANLTTVGGELRISQHSELENIQGLANLMSVGKLSILSNVRLENLSGLHRLSNITSLSVEQNFALKNIDGLLNITSIRNISLSGNKNLTNVNGLSNLVGTITSLRLQFNGFLDIDGFSKITTILDQLYIIGHLKLTNLNGLSNVTYINSLIIDDNAVLPSVLGLCNALGNGSTIIEGDALECVPLNLPVIETCPCVDFTCPCCIGSSCQNPTSVTQVLRSRDNITRNGTSNVGLYGKLLDRDESIKIGSVTFKDNVLMQDEVLLVDTFNASSVVYQNEAIFKEIERGRVVSSIVSLSLESGLDEFDSDDGVIIQLLCKTNSSRLGLYYVDVNSVRWRLQSVAQIVKRLSNGLVYAEAATSHFTDFAILLLEEDQSSSQITSQSSQTEDDNDVGDGDGSDGGTGDGLSSEALAGIIIGCVVGAIIIVILSIVIIIIIVVVRSHKKSKVFTTWWPIRYSVIRFFWKSVFNV